MAAGRLYKPKAKSFWTLVRRLLLRRGQRPSPAVGGAEEDRREEKSGLLLSRSSLEHLLVTDDGAPAGDGDVCRCPKKHGRQPVAVALLPRPDQAAAVSSAATAVGGRGGGAAVHRRFVFGGFRRRLLMRRPWRPALVAIPE